MEDKKPLQPGQAKHPKKERIAQIRKAVKEQRANINKEEALKSRLEKGHDESKAFEQYPEGEKLKTHAVQAEIRRRISKAAFEHDQKLSPKEQEEIIERQINRYYDHDLGDPDLRGHIEAPHGTKPSKKIEEWCKEKKVASHETNTDSISKETANYMVFKRPRLTADVNSLPKGIESSLRSEGVVYTKEDNLNAVKAERDLTGKMIEEQHNLDAEGKAINPYLAIYLHGKVDTRGHDFEIAAKQEHGKGPLNPLLAFWIAERLKIKIAEKGIKNSKNEIPTVNVVTYKGAYSGSNALTALRHGDGTLNFKGFGENFQALQLEVGAHIRKTHPEPLGEMLQEILQDFAYEFKTPADMDMKKLAQYQPAYEAKLRQEQDELFNLKNLGFTDETPEDKIALGKTLREALEVESGDMVKIGGKELKVTMMKAADLKSGKTMLLHSSWKDKIGEKLELEKAGGEDEKDETAKHTKSAAEQTGQHEDAHGESHTEKKGEHKEEKKTGWRNRLKFFFGLIGDKIKSILGIGRSGH